MKKEDYLKYRVQGGDIYVLPEDTFNEVFDELSNLQQENQELKKQLEETNKTEIYIDSEDIEKRYCDGLYQEYLEKENQELNKENDRLAAKLNKNKILQNEFRKWLENESKELIRDAGYHQKICLDILEKYKEIIGVIR